MCLRDIVLFLCLLTPRFIAVKELEPTQMVSQARLLLQEPEIETAVRLGDIYAIIIELVAMLLCLIQTKK